MKKEAPPLVGWVIHKSAEKHLAELKREMGRVIKLVDSQNTP